MAEVGQGLFLGSEPVQLIQNNNFVFSNPFFEAPAPVTSSIPVKDGLVLGLTMESISYNGTGSTWYDISGNEFHHTIYGSPTWDATNGFTMNGSSQYMQSSLASGEAMGNFFTGSVGQMMLFFDGLRGAPYSGEIHNIWRNDGGGNLGRYYVKYTTSGGAGAVQGEYLGSAGGFLIDSGQNVDEGSFRKLVVYASGSVGSGYTEKSFSPETDLENPQTLSGTWATTSGYSTVGARDTSLGQSGYYNGNIRNVLLYNRFLSSGERTSIYNWLNSLT